MSEIDRLEIELRRLVNEIVLEKIDEAQILIDATQQALSDCDLDRAGKTLGQLSKVLQSGELLRWEN